MVTLQDILDLTKKLIAIPSDTNDRDACLLILEFVQKELYEYTSTPYVRNGISSLLYSNTDSIEQRFKLIFNVHLDVVPTKPDQFRPFEKNGRLYGRGAYDMKGAGAVMILLFRELAKKVSYPLALQITTDEESGGFHGTKYQTEKGLRGDFIIAGESTNLRIIYQAKGRIILKLIARGLTAHAAYPWRGDNAILKIHEAIAVFSKLYPYAKEETEETIMNVTKLEIENSSYNKIPDNCTVHFDIRYNPKEKNTIINSIKRCIPEGLESEFFIIDSPHDTDPQNPYVQLLYTTAHTAFTHAGALSKAHGTSDLPYFASVGCDGVEFGPIGHGHHGENEWVDIQSLEDYYYILKKFLLSL